MVKYYSARELALMQLPDMPATKEGMLKRAEVEKWKFREATGLGGVRREFKVPAYIMTAISELKTSPEMAIAMASAEYKSKGASPSKKGLSRKKAQLSPLGDGQLLQRIIFTLETWLEQNATVLKPERKATLIPLLYRYFENEDNVEEAMLVDMIQRSI